MKLAVLLVVAVVLTGCGEIKFPPQRSIYKLACKAVRADTNFPPDAVLHPMADAELYIGKNAACVKLPYDYVNASGKTVTVSCTVWLKNMAHSWEVDRLYPTPK